MTQSKPDPIPNPASRDRWLPTLHVSILSLALTTILILGISLTWFNYARNSRTALDVAHSLLTEINSKVVQQIQASFQRMQTLAELIPQLPSVDTKPRDMNHPLLGYLLEALGPAPEFYSFYLAFADGDFYQVVSLTSDPDAGKVFRAPEKAAYLVRYIQTDARSKRQAAMLFLDKNKQPIGKAFSLDNSYDPRGRPWFEQAMPTDQLIRTNLYVFASLHHLGVTFAKRFASGNGVFGIDVTLKTLSDIVSGQTVSPRGRVFLFNSQGQVLAYPDPDKAVISYRNPNCGTVYLPSLISDLGDPVSEALFREFAGGTDLGQGVIRFEHDGESYLGLITPLTGAYSRDEYVGLVTPESDFTGPLVATRTQSLVFALAMLGLSIPLVVVFVLRISRPLKALAVESDKIGNFELDSPLKVDSFIREVHQLSIAMGTMKHALRTFGKYVPKNLVQRIVRSRIKPELGGERRELSIMFTDVADFTTMSEAMEPEALMLKTSEYFQAISGLINELDGTIDKFIGDAVMAFWNAPVHVENHALRACQAALEVSDKSEELNRHWEAQGERIMFTRIGLHLDDAVVGNIGATDRMNYTAIGQAVNLASRLEGLNKYYGTRILVSRTMRDRAECCFLFRSVALAQPKGTASPLELFELLGAKENCHLDCTQVDQEALDRHGPWERAMAHYREARFSEALTLFEEFLAMTESDALVSIYLQRCRRLAKNPPGKDWTPVDVFETK